MSLFKVAKNESAYLKCGIYGFEGSGKTFTAMKIAVGLWKYAKLQKPVAMIDTETGSSFLVEEFKKEKIPFVVSKSRAYVDMVSGLKEAEKNCSILIIDSVTHIWHEFMDAYREKKKLKRIALHHWVELKDEWRTTYAYDYVNSALHIIECGRAGWDWGESEDDEGFSERKKTGTKKKTESESAFEPSLLIEMERKKDEKIGGFITNRAWIMKDRTNSINGMFFDRPTFESFLPHISKLNLHGKHVGFDAKRSSKNHFTGPVLKSDRTKIYEEIIDELKLAFSTSRADTVTKIKLLKQIFGTSSDSAIKNMPHNDLMSGLKKIREMDIQEFIKQNEKEEKKDGNAKN